MVAGVSRTPQEGAGQAAFAVPRLTCGNDHFSMVSLRRVWKNAGDSRLLRNSCAVVWNLC